MRARRLVATMAALLLLATAACSDSDDDSSSDTTGSSTTEGPPSSPEPQDPLEILVTNDDGVEGAGIDALVESLRSIENVNVTVVAPADDRTGTGGQTTEGELEVTDVELASGYPAKAVAGFPADTVRVAIDDLGLEPDLVVSGINAGQNLGVLVDVSGTVGAARAAATRGVPALAVSSGTPEPIDYEAALPFVLQWVEDHRTVLVEGTAPDEVANMNLPTCTTGQIRELIEVPLAPAGTTGAVAPQDCTSTLTDPPNDIVAFNTGYATITDPIPLEPAG